MLKKEELLSDNLKNEIGFSYYIWNGYLEPAVDDIDRDGNKEIVVYAGGNPPKIAVYRPDGSLFWSKGVGTQDMAGGNLHIPLIGDLDNDGYGEIIAFNIGDAINTNKSEVYAFNHDGSLLWKTLIPLDFHPTLLMADLNYDGNKEIVIKGNDAWEMRMTILDKAGNIQSGWDLLESHCGGSIEGSPAVGNFDDDSDLEIVSAQPTINCSNFMDGAGVISVYNMDGSVVSGWPQYLPGYPYSSPTVGDINNDGNQEIILGLMYSSETFPDTRYGGLYAFDRNGNLLPGWPVLKGWNFWSTPALADINNDGNLEISASRLGFVTYLLDKDGNILPHWPQYTAWNDYYSSIQADINNDDSIDILTTAGGIYSCQYSNCGGLYAWTNDGGLISAFPKVTEVDAQAPSVVDDIDNDGKIELIASSDWDTDFSVNGIDKHRGSLYVWDIDSDINRERMPWPQFMHDPQHTGCYDCNNTFSQPRPKSQILNTGSVPIKGNLLMKVQNYYNGFWEDYQVVIDNIEYSVPLNDHLALDKIWNENDIRITEPGRFRVYAAFLYDGKVIQAKEGKLESYWDFNVG